MRIAIAGGSGSLGQRLAHDAVRRGHDVVILTRSPKRGGHREVLWDGETVGPWASELEGAVIINLAGLLVDRRPTRDNIRALTDSRVNPTRALVEASKTLTTPPPVWLQMSTLAIYGNRGDEILTEESAIGDGLPQQTGVAVPWEAALEGARARRIVVLRTGIVLDRDTPVLRKLITVVRRGAGGRVGNGRQWISWIHIDDFLAALWRLADDPSLSGVFHITAPNPVTNDTLMRALRRRIRPFFALRTPAWLVRAGSIPLRTDPALALTGRRCVPRRLEEGGFQFHWPDLDAALGDLMPEKAS